MLPEFLCADGSHQRHILWYIPHSRYIYSDPPQKLHRTDNGKSLLLSVLPSDCETGRGRSLPVLFHLLSPGSGVWMYRNCPRKYCFYPAPQNHDGFFRWSGYSFHVHNGAGKSHPPVLLRSHRWQISVLYTHHRRRRYPAQRSDRSVYLPVHRRSAVSSDPGYPAYCPIRSPVLRRRSHAYTVWSQSALHRIPVKIFPVHPVHGYIF